MLQDVEELPAAQRETVPDEVVRSSATATHPAARVSASVARGFTEAVAARSTRRARAGRSHHGARCTDGPRNSCCTAQTTRCPAAAAEGSGDARPVTRPEAGTAAPRERGSRRGRGSSGRPTARKPVQPDLPSGTDHDHIALPVGEPYQHPSRGAPGDQRLRSHCHHEASGRRQLELGHLFLLGTPPSHLRSEASDHPSGSFLTPFRQASPPLRPAASAFRQGRPDHRQRPVRALPEAGETGHNVGGEPRPAFPRPGLPGPLARCPGGGTR